MMRATTTGCCPCSAWTSPEVRGHRQRVQSLTPHRLSSTCVCTSESEDQREEMLRKFGRFQHLAELYHVYRSIQRYTVSKTRKRLIENLKRAADRPVKLKVLGEGHVFYTQHVFPNCFAQSALSDFLSVTASFPVVLFSFCFDQLLCQNS